MVLKDCLEWGKSLKIICIFYFEYFISFIIIKREFMVLWKYINVVCMRWMEYCYVLGFFFCIYFLRGICIFLFLFWFELLLLLLVFCVFDLWVLYNGCLVICLLLVCYMIKFLVSLLDRYSVDWYCCVYINNL